MSIATEIERIQNAKSSIKTAIENKGVVVGDGALDTYASKIDEISSGSGIDLEITDCDYLFYINARKDSINDILPFCKNVTSCKYMFSQSSAQTLDLRGLDVSKVTNMNNMIGNCQYLTSLNVEGWDTSNVTDMAYFLYLAQYLQIGDKLKHFKTGKVMTMASLFSMCYGNAKLDLSTWDVSNVTNMNAMFYQNNNLSELNITGWDTSKVTNTQNLFSTCPKLKDIIELNLSSSTNVYNVLYKCKVLENFGGFKDLGKGYTQKSSNYANYKLDLSTCTSLTHDSLMNVINKLYDLNLTYDVANGGTLYTQQLVLGVDNLAKLTEEEVAIATNKGWVVS